jgi:cell division septation protein DedD
MSQDNKQDQTTRRDRDERSAQSAESARAPMNVRLNHQKRELYVSMTRAVAGVSVASFCGMLIGIMALSRNVTNTGPQAAKASTSYQMPAVRPVKIKAPKLTSANGGKSTPTADAAPVVAPPTTQPKLERSIITENPKPLVANPTTAPSVVTRVSSNNEPRSVGRVYFIFGSFPDAADAKSVVDKLKKKGIPCTVERSLPDWTYEGWFSVVSVKGFLSTKDQAYQKEIKALEDKDLEPCPYKWRRAQRGA